MATYAWTPTTFLDDASLQSPTASRVNGEHRMHQVTATSPGCSIFNSVQSLTLSAPIAAADKAQDTALVVAPAVSSHATVLPARTPTCGAPGGETTASIDMTPRPVQLPVTDGYGGSVNTGDTVTELAIPHRGGEPALLCDGASQVLTASGADSCTRCARCWPR
ncbi:MAG: hypothetical protein U0V45_05160 [Flavobacteriales bacterium]